MVNNANIDWLFPWPDEALLAVATELITPDNPLVPANYRPQVSSLINFVLLFVYLLFYLFIYLIRQMAANSKTHNQHKAQ